MGGNEGFVSSDDPRSLLILKKKLGRLGRIFASHLGFQNQSPLILQNEDPCGINIRHSLLGSSLCPSVPRSRGISGEL